jgi:hypothetical protein
VAVDILSCICVALRLQDLGVLEDGGVVAGSFFGLAIEAKTWSDFAK